MSAIFGILDLNGRQIDPNWVNSMEENLSHRGPDGQGVYREDSLVLGNMLLQVTPESVYDKSPYEEDGLVITANARLDERAELMDKLNINHALREKITDPILLLRCYKKWGKDFVKYIYGDFSFAIWDKEKKELFCARDHMGVKPFLYYFHDNRFVFSTELKSIVRLPFVKTEIDHNYLRDTVICVWDQPQKTVWKNVERLKPAHTLSFKGSSIIRKQYWVPTYKRNKQFKTEADSAIALHKVLEKVIDDHTRVIGEVGATLSGGLDSSTVTCLAARKLSKEGKTITTASSIYHPDFNDPEEPDEIEFINEVIEQEKNITPTFVYHSDLEFLNGLYKKFDRHYSHVNGYYYVDEALYEQLRKKSVRRVLTGYLGDFTVSNSSIYPFTHLFLTGRIATLKKLLYGVKIKSDQTIKAFIKSGILNQLAPKFLQKAWLKYKGNPDLTRDIGELPLILTKSDKQILQRKVLSSFSVSNIRKKDISKNLWPNNWDLFEEDWDCGTSHYQIEMTYPLADRRVVELLLQIPVEHFWAESVKRGLLRKAMTGIIPEKVRLRKNKGHYSPGYPWLVKKDIGSINKLIQKEDLNVQLGHLVDLQRLKVELENLSESKNNDSFGYKNWILVELIIWIIFSQWSSTNIKK